MQDFHKVQKFNHPGVQYVDFSPCERYIVTFAPHHHRGTSQSSVAALSTFFFS